MTPITLLLIKKSSYIITKIMESLTSTLLEIPLNERRAAARLLDQSQECWQGLANTIDSLNIANDVEGGREIAKIEEYDQGQVYSGILGCIKDWSNRGILRRVANSEDIIADFHVIATPCLTFKQARIDAPELLIKSGLVHFADRNNISAEVADDFCVGLGAHHILGHLSGEQSFEIGIMPREANDVLMGLSSRVDYSSDASPSSSIKDNLSIRSVSPLDVLSHLFGHELLTLVEADDYITEFNEEKTATGKTAFISLSRDMELTAGNA
jgi:hypothetical protein